MNPSMMRRGRFTVAFASLLMLFVLIPGIANGQGMIIEPPRHIDPPPMPSEWLELKSVDVDITVEGQFATFHITQIFHNNTSWDQEGTYLFPLPTDAEISDFALYLDGKKLNSEVLDAATARKTYEDIVRSMRDPGLLEYVGQGVIKCRIYPIPAYGDKKVEVEYRQLLTRDGDMFKIHLPLDLSGFPSSTIQSLNIDADIRMKNLSNVYCPTHDVEVETGNDEAHVSLSRNHYNAARDFVLYLVSPAKEVGVDFIAHETDDDEGFFLALITAGVPSTEMEYIPKDFAFVLDRSGSMDDQDKIGQAKEALKFVFRNLNANDRFNFITFASEVTPYNDGWKNVSSSAISDVQKYIDTISAGGGTAIDDALKAVLDLPLSSTRPTYVIFLTDGLPTVGEQRIDTILANVLDKNEGRAHMFSFGVGYDLNFVFIDRLSRENGGFSASVAPGENLEASLSQFYGRIKTPLLTDCEVDFDGFRVDAVFPVDMPDIFLGSQIAISGKYFGRPVGHVTFTGYVGSQKRTFRLSVDERGDDNEFVPRIWARRRVGFLLNQNRLYGNNQEIIDEIVKLAKKYGIITPYTSYLVVEDTPMAGNLNFDMAIGPTESFNSLGYIGAGGAAAPPSGKSAHRSSREMSALEEEAFMEDRVQAGEDEYLQEVGDKTFILDGEVWKDTEYDEDESYDWVEIEFLSDEYFDLIADDEDLAQFFSVGDSVIIIYEGTAYKVVPSD